MNRLAIQPHDLRPGYAIETAGYLSTNAYRVSYRYRPDPLRNIEDKIVNAFAGPRAHEAYLRAAHFQLYDQPYTSRVASPAVGEEDVAFYVADAQGETGIIFRRNHYWVKVSVIGVSPQELDVVLALAKLEDNRVRDNG